MTGNEKDVAFVSLMQPDTRNLKKSGKSNLIMGFFVMKVSLTEKHLTDIFVRFNFVLLLLDIQTHLASLGNRNGDKGDGCPRISFL